MGIDSQLQMIHNTAQLRTKDGKTCRDVLLSLWDDGMFHGCDLRELLSLDHDHYSAIQQVLDCFYNNKQRLDQYMTTRQITALDEVDEVSEGHRGKGSKLGVADSYSKVGTRR